MESIPRRRREVLRLADGFQGDLAILGVEGFDGQCDRSDPTATWVNFTGTVLWAAIGMNRTEGEP